MWTVERRGQHWVVANEDGEIIEEGFPDEQSALCWLEFQMLAAEEGGSD